MLSCCFTGHRAMTTAEQKQLLPILDEKVLDAMNQGVTIFRNGGALGFDTLSALHIIGLRKKYSNIKLLIDAPHRQQSAHWKDTDKDIYDYILRCADGVTYVSEHYTSQCMQKRNRFMVDHSDMVIAYVRTPRGGSYYTACYAESLDKTVVYL